MQPPTDKQRLREKSKKERSNNSKVSPKCCTRSSTIQDKATRKFDLIGCLLQRVGNSHGRSKFRLLTTSCDDGTNNSNNNNVNNEDE
jgi:hypothetical protein